ncbi:MAG: hypothetical protein JXK07_11725 [Spirochaetes bacterium]|nr:hypothetical protein [Spirochaetota bacterium]MBN2769903.1 hypothetical protein [Spirochaetota bacterium]
MHQSNMRLEEKTKRMIARKDIPDSKMEAVNALLKNAGLQPHEKYNAVIQLIQDCPDKPRPVKSVTASKPKTAILPESASRRTETPVKLSKKTTVIPSPASGSYHVNALLKAYKETGLFKKRYLIESSNFLKFWIKKRIVPSRKLFRVFRTIYSYQEKIAAVLPQVMEDIVNDPAITSPIIFNHLRLLRKWMLNIPFLSAGYNQCLWFDTAAFEAELLPYARMVFSFSMIETELRENIILMFESKLREQSDYKKDIISENDPESSSKQKRNLAREKAVYDIIVTLRSFMPDANTEGSLDRYLKNSTKIANLRDLTVVLLETLIFRRQMSRTELKRYYSIKAPDADPTRWECSRELLKKAGKDNESLRKARLEALKKELEPYDEMVELINLKIDGQELTYKAFSDNWHIFSNKRQEFGNYPEENFFFFLDDCTNYFVHVYMPLLNGSPQKFVSSDQTTFEGAIFTPGYFESKISMLLDIQRDLFAYRTKNPNSLISLDEVRKIQQGKLATMTHIKSFVDHMGAVFYAFAVELHAVYRAHQRFMELHPSTRPESSKEPLRPGVVHDHEDDGFLLPFYDMKIAKQDKLPPLVRTIVGKYIMSDSVRDGLFKCMLSFCYQMAYECRFLSLEHDLNRRTEIRRSIEAV